MKNRMTKKIYTVVFAFIAIVMNAQTPPPPPEGGEGDIGNIATSPIDMYSAILAIAAVLIIAYSVRKSQQLNKI